MTVCAIRGATCLQADDADEMAVAVAELVEWMLADDHLSADDLISVLLTCTPDLHSAFPAAGARRVPGMSDVPHMCAQELDVAGALPRTVRVLMHAHGQKARGEVVHVFLRGAQVLRPDLAT